MCVCECERVGGCCFRWRWVGGFVHVFSIFVGRQAQAAQRGDRTQTADDGSVESWSDWFGELESAGGEQQR